ncbi:MAG: prolipoprotein diacylglyceryl transferase [Chloroflexi bacterium]|nr:prolipoprotein diacylglyceryl transferase [Chloroflexota bacterium]
MLPTIQIGPAALPVRPLLMLIAWYIAVGWAERRMPRYGQPSEHAWNAGLIAALGAVIGGRLYYAVTNWAAYQMNPLGLFATSISTIAFGEGLIVGLIGAAIYLRWKRAPLAPFFDAYAPGLLAAFALASVGALASGDAYGAATDLPWAIVLWDSHRHPSQVYELLVALAALAVVLRMRGASDGSTFLAAVALYGIGRVFIEAFRGDSWLVADGVRAMQVVWLAAALGALIVMRRRASIS